MKLRNKKTGEIGELHFEPDKEYHFTVTTEDPADMMIYKNLADLYADWEDYEEREKYWYLTDAGCLCDTSIHNDKTAVRKRIGNYFETKEEAEKAVEKLKAWKRLTDKGFRFTGCVFDNYIRFELPYMEWDKNISDDLDLLFGGEE